MQHVDKYSLRVVSKVDRKTIDQLKHRSDSNQGSDYIAIFISFFPSCPFRFLGTQFENLKCAFSEELLLTSKLNMQNLKCIGFVVVKICTRQFKYKD